MCVILHGLKKRHMRRPEIAEAMKANPSGFCMFALHPDRTRESIRTLSENELLRFFDEKVGDEDAVCMHARIPSRGMEKTVDNVHGWEEDGVAFMHNMTISEVDDFMKESNWKGTDSEFFFRKIFMPVYRGLGAAAYRDGKLDPCLDMIVRTYIGYSNKFLFIMPDNGVLKYGKWVNEPDRKEGGEIAFWASNSTYKVYERTWPAQKWEPPHGPTGPRWTDDEFDPYGIAGECDSGFGEGWRTPRAKAPETKSPGTTGFFSCTPVEYDGKYIRGQVGDALVAQIGIMLHVLAGVADARRLALHELGLGKGVLDIAIEALNDTVDAACDSLLLECADVCDGTSAKLGVEAGSPEQTATWLDGWSSILEEMLETDGKPTTTRYYHKMAITLRKDAFDLADAVKAALAALDCTVDFGKEDPDEAIRAYVPAISRKGRLTAARVRLTDIVTPPDMTAEGAIAAMKAALAVARKEK